MKKKLVIVSDVYKEKVEKECNDLFDKGYEMQHFAKVNCCGDKSKYQEPIVYFTAVMVRKAWWQIWI